MFLKKSFVQLLLYKVYRAGYFQVLLSKGKALFMSSIGRLFLMQWAYFLLKISGYLTEIHPYVYYFNSI